MCCENKDDKVYVYGYTSFLRVHGCILYGRAYVLVHCDVICAPTTVMYIRRAACVGFLSLDASRPLIRGPPTLFYFLSLFPAVWMWCRVQNRWRKRRLVDREEKHLAALKSYHSGEEGIKAPECSLGPSADRMTCLRARLFASCCYNILCCTDQRGYLYQVHITERYGV